jgi:hypothetical protein
MVRIKRLLCSCGAQLMALSELPGPECVIACPTRHCRVKHVVIGEVRGVFLVDERGNSQPYDWERAQGTAA